MNNNTVKFAVEFMYYNNRIVMGQILTYTNVISNNKVI